MHLPLAFLSRPEGGTVKIPHAWVEASDWFVLFTLGTLFFLLGAFALWAWIIWQRSAKPEPHMQLLMELENELENEKPEAPSVEEADGKAPWVQSADWWKKADD